MNRYVGVDLGIRTNHRAAVLDGPLPRGKPFSFTVTRGGFEELLRRATEGVEGPVKFVLEPTGLAWVPLAAYVSSAGHEVYLAKPKKASDLRKFLHQHVKSDSADAEANALLPQMDPRGVHRLRLPTAEQMTLRRLVKRRERLVRQASDGKRRIHALMVMANPPLMAALGESAFGDAAMAFYRRYADPEQVMKLGLPRLGKFWHRASRGKADPRLAERVFKACQTTVELYSEQRRTGQLPFDYVAVAEELQAELDWIDRCEQEVAQLDDRITEIYHRIDPDRVLETIPGIAKVIAPAIEAFVGDVERFLNSRCFVSNCGLCPRKKQSGLSDQPMPITKAGAAAAEEVLLSGCGDGAAVGSRVCCLLCTSICEGRRALPDHDCTGAQDGLARLCRAEAPSAGTTIECAGSDTTVRTPESRGPADRQKASSAADSREIHSCQC
jgi:transposase